MKKEEVLKDIENGTCPVCKSKMSFWLIEDGKIWKSYECNKCNITANLSYKTILDNITIFDEYENETEFEF